MFGGPILLEINGVLVKSPKIGGITRKPEKVWSANTKRAASTLMVGTIKSIKYTYSIEWPPLTMAEQELIESLVSNKDIPFAPMRVTRPNGEIWEKTFYFGTPSFTEWEWIDGQWKSTNNKVDAIER